MADVRDDDEIFVYTGGDQEVPRGVRRARIHKSIKIIPSRAFVNRENLVYVEFHDEIEIIEVSAFHGCTSLRGCIKLLGVKIIRKSAFHDCIALTGVVGDKLERIEVFSFYRCISLRNIKMTSVRTIGVWAFTYCSELSDLDFGEDLETIQAAAFENCHKLKRIVLPLKGNMFTGCAFGNCSKLTAVDLVGEIHNNVASLHLEEWRSEMMDEINRINQVLPNTDVQKSRAIQQWIRSVIQRLNQYKSKHHTILKEATTLLELALWKANLDGNKGGEREGVRTTRGSRKRARQEICVTSGASIVIKNVLPFLVLK